VKVKRGKLEIWIAIEELVRRIERCAAVSWGPVDATILLRSLAQNRNIGPVVSTVR
jgi:hypothetical protein